MQIKEYIHYSEPEILTLYASVGWTAYTDDPQALRQGFAHSLLTLAAYDDSGRLLGLIRTVGDGQTIVLVQDLLVLPDSQRQGVSTQLLQAICRRFARVRQLQLTTDATPKTLAFYRSQGFSEFSQLGCCGFMRT